MDRYLSAILTSAVLLFAACAKQPAADQQPETVSATPITRLPEITAESEEGFVDLVFRVQSHERLADGSQIIRAAGLHKGREVGFELALGPTWTKAELAKGIPVQTSQEVSYRRTGPESDAFLQVLDELYRTEQKPNAMAANTPFAAISLEGDPANLASGPVKIKLFYEKGGDKSYAELYTNIDLPARRLEVHEKDEGYRRPIIEALRAIEPAKR